MVVDERPEVGHARGGVGGRGGHHAVRRGRVDAGQPGEAGEEREGRRVVAEKLHLFLRRGLFFHREETLDCLLPVPRAVHLRLLLFSLAECLGPAWPGGQ